MLRFSGVALSHVGLVRSGNEDSGFLGPTCMLVADGVGGAAAGEVASATTAYVVSATALADTDDRPGRRCVRAIRLAQEQVALGVRRDPTATGMATTLTAVATDGERFALAHVGDSRGYVFRDGDLTRVTRDHTYVQRLVDEGSLAEEDVPLPPVAQRRDPQRRTATSPSRVTSRSCASCPVTGVLLASDGLTDLVPEPHIEQILTRHDDDAAVERLLDAALAAGGRDNVTCLLATVVDGPGRRRPTAYSSAPCATRATSWTPRRSGCRTAPERRSLVQESAA